MLDVGAGPVAEIPDSAAWTVDLDFSSDGRQLAGVGVDGRLAVWNVESMTRITVMAPGVETLASGQRLLSDSGIVQVEFLPGSDELVTVRVSMDRCGSGILMMVATASSRSSSFSPWLDGICLLGWSATVVVADNTGKLRLLTSMPERRSFPGYECAWSIKHRLLARWSISRRWWPWPSGLYMGLAIR